MIWVTLSCWFRWWNWPDNVELLLIPVLLPADGEAVNPGDVPGHVVGQVVGKEHDLTQQDVRQVGFLVAPFNVDLVFDDVTDHLLLLLPDLLFGAAVLALLFGAVQEALLLGDLGGLDPILGDSHKVVDGLVVAAVPAVVLDKGRETGIWTDEPFTWQVWVLRLNDISNCGSGCYDLKLIIWGLYVNNSPRRHNCSVAFTITIVSDSFTLLITHYQNLKLIFLRITVQNL